MECQNCKFKPPCFGYKEGTNCTHPLWKPKLLRPCPIDRGLVSEEDCIALPPVTPPTVKKNLTVEYCPAHGYPLPCNKCGNDPRYPNYVTPSVPPEAMMLTETADTKLEQVKKILEGIFDEGLNTVKEVGVLYGIDLSGQAQEIVALFPQEHNKQCESCEDVNGVIFENRMAQLEAERKAQLERIFAQMAIIYEALRRYQRANPIHNDSESALYSYGEEATELWFALKKLQGGV